MARREKCGAPSAARGNGFLAETELLSIRFILSPSHSILGELRPPAVRARAPPPRPAGTQCIPISSNFYAEDFQRQNKLLFLNTPEIRHASDQANLINDLKYMACVNFRECKVALMKNEPRLKRRNRNNEVRGDNAPAHSQCRGDSSLRYVSTGMRLMKE
ncbi:hypothetical protein EVAR_53948_1 [Eumeta japonica]|uniref:Uncharacterized protein n=1 Tax=Eumeta variegata TaxID=151549 RepID=A0A4C1ZE95_EUMVA|nr:hypothetical protein EVAR_53948_1 [Eumeta japonica]